MALDSAPIARLAAELMDQLDEDLPEGTELEDVLLVVEVSFPAEDPDEDGQRETEVRVKGTSDRSVVALGLAEIAAQIQREPDHGEE